MFNHPFSFEGRIRRSEFGLSYILVVILVYAAIFLAVVISKGNDDTAGITYIILLVPINWFCYAQGAKRCHDVGHCGWWQIIPLYFFWMLFQDGEEDANEYGESPKYHHTHQAPANNVQHPAVQEPHVVSPSMKTQRMDAKTIMSEENNSVLGKLIDEYGQTYPLSRGINTIGRADSSSTATVQILTNDRYMSRNHAIILANPTNQGFAHVLKYGDNHQISIFHNGVLLNIGSSLYINNGDVIRLGHTELTFMI